MLLVLGLIVCAVLGAFVFAPKPGKPAGASPAIAWPEMPEWMRQPQAPAQGYAPEPRVSLREQQLAEEAAAIASEYSGRSDAAWRAELRAKAAVMLADGKAAKA